MKKLLNWKKIFSYSIAESSLLLISLIIICGAGIYYFFNLSGAGVLATVLLSLLAWRLLAPRLLTKASPLACPSLTLTTKFCLSGYLLLYLTSFAYLFSQSTAQAIISPWELVTWPFFLLYALSGGLLLYLLNQATLKSLPKTLLLTLHYFLSFGVALVVYQISYGFDPFIHEATLKVIAEAGAIWPKPAYYLGDYSLIIVLHRLTGLSIVWLNKYLITILAAIFLPWAIIKFLTTNQISSKQPRAHYLSALMILALGYAPFIISTPQSLGYLLLILTVLIGLSKRGWGWPLVLSLATTAVHPLAGLPALGWTLILIVSTKSRAINQWAKPLLFIANALILPLALLFSGQNKLRLEFNLATLGQSLASFFNQFSWAGQESASLNLAYFASHNYLLWLSLLLISAYLIWRRSKFKLPPGTWLMPASLLSGYFLSNLIVFQNVIDYEQANFPSRILITALIFLLPLLLISFTSLIDRILATPRPARYCFAGAGLIILLLSLYLSYPRFDDYFNSRGYSSSWADQQAVRLINQEATAPYVVLANQQVSAMALKEFGFSHYLTAPWGETFYYPIPTGGPLYKYYLDLVYQELSQTKLAELKNDLALAEVYLVINKYWHQSELLISEAKLQAKRFWSIADEVFIFVY
ncbi:MAG: hypothetical protein ACOX0C_03345 [Patescibacteria group bacterium]|jgi:hypothetical protein